MPNMRMKTTQNSLPVVQLSELTRGFYDHVPCRGFFALILRYILPVLPIFWKIPLFWRKSEKSGGGY